MLNLKNFKTDAQNIAQNLAKRQFILDTDTLLKIQNETKKLRLELEELQRKANQNLNTKEDKIRAKNIKETLFELEATWFELTAHIPNLLHETVPDGKGAEDNPVVKVFNLAATDKTLAKKDYCDIGLEFGLDTDLGATLAGARFNVMRGEVAKLHRKLINAALDFYATRGYEEFYVPNLVKEETLFGTGQYPKFRDDMFKTQHTEELYLIPTGEVPLTNVVRDKINQQPNQKMMTHTPCFRKEAGNHGKDTRGIIRQHQFEKVELVRTCTPEMGLDNFKQMVEDITAFIEQLGMTFRIIELCAGDIGFAGHKAYDFEIWFEQQQCWREIATVTWCHDFQARRMNARYKDAQGKNELLHTLNGTGLAAGRVLAALLENCYTQGELKLPDILK